MRANRGNLWPRARLSGDASLERQRHEAMIGANVRSWLAEHGSPIWEPAEDRVWRDWIERHGDMYARGFLVELDEPIRREVAEGTERDPELQRQNTMVGAELRSRLAEQGSPTWEPAEDDCWREWIEFQGDAYARHFLKELDEVVRCMTPGMVEHDE